MKQVSLSSYASGFSRWPRLRPSADRLPGGHRRTGWGLVDQVTGDRCVGMFDALSAGPGPSGPVAELAVHRKVQPHSLDSVHPGHGTLWMEPPIAPALQQHTSPLVRISYELEMRKLARRYRRRGDPSEPSELFDEPGQNFGCARVDLNPLFCVCVRADVVEAAPSTLVVGALGCRRRPLGRAVLTQFQAASQCGAHDGMAIPAHGSDLMAAVGRAPVPAAPRGTQDSTSVHLDGAGGSAGRPRSLTSANRPGWRLGVAVAAPATRHVERFDDGRRAVRPKPAVGGVADVGTTRGSLGQLVGRRPQLTLTGTVSAILVPLNP